MRIDFVTIFPRMFDPLLAEGIIARHDENYVPRELQDMTEAQKRQAIAGTTE